ncbi:DUF6250 domain-containing protein [Akkermansiaceae bacterium]|nr:DUF6250 domain-containing protein [Akkermansiaceae bacterium]
MKLGSCFFVFWFVLSPLASAEESPQVLGKGKGLFQIGEQLAQDDFKNLEGWVVQLEEREGEAWVKAQDGKLDCFVPDRGCTVWFKKKLKTRVTITYDVLCPTSKEDRKGLQPSDLNNFWMASDPASKLFDSSRFSGKFGDYDVMHGYYASSGGGRNTTTRMRRYPRAVGGRARRASGSHCAGWAG